MTDNISSGASRKECGSEPSYYDTHIRPALLAIERRELEERRRREDMARQEQERRKAEMEQGFEEMRDMLSRMAAARRTAPLPEPEPEYEPEYDPEFDGGDIEGRLDAILDRLDALADGQKRIEARMDGMEARMDAMEQSMQSLAEHLDRVDKRLDGVDKHLDGVEQSMAALQAEHKPSLKQAGISAMAPRPARSAASDTTRTPVRASRKAQAITCGAPTSAGAPFLPSRAPPGRPMTPGRVVRHYTLHPRDPPWT